MQTVSVSTVAFTVAARIPCQWTEKGMGTLQLTSTPPGLWVTLGKGTAHINSQAIRKQCYIPDGYIKY